MHLNCQLVRQKTAKTINGLLYSVRPNITGFSNIAGYFDPLTTAGGALSASTRWTFTIMREPGTASGIVNFNAAGSNPIYGASTTNQPAAIRGYWLIRFN